MLICVGGRGYYQEWGKEPREMVPGTVINIPANVKHWLTGSKSGGAVWGALTAALTSSGELSATIGGLNIEVSKLYAFCVIPKAIRDLEIGYVEKYFRAILAEAMYDGIAAGYIDGDGKEAPIGILRKVGQTESDGTHSAKSVVSTLLGFSPLQMACYIGTLANGGNRYAAHTLKMAISSTSGDVLRRSQKELVSSAGISAENYAAVMSGMLEASATGTAANVFSDYPIQVASKTGSAQTGLTSDNAVFVCCAPYDAPEIAVVVVVEEGGQGSLIGSVAKDVLDSYFYVSSTSGVQTEGSLIQ